MTKRFGILIVLIFMAVGLTGCDQYFFGFSILHPLANAPIAGNNEGESPSSPSHGGPVTDYVSLVDHLSAVGADVTPADSVSQPFFEIVGQVIVVNSENVQVFEFADDTTAEAATAQIAPDGSSVETIMIDWVASPHFYRSGRLIVLYVGDNEDIVNLLESVLGPQFAGG